MKPAYLLSDSGNRDRWTVSYVDVLTILLIFFIAAAAKLPVVTHTAPSPVVASKPVLADEQQLLAKRGLDARLEDRGLVVSLPQTILFASGDDRIADGAIPVIEQIAAVIGKLPNRVILCGHADSTPIHNRRFKNNWELSTARGLRLLELLIDKYRIEESRLSVSSDGANRPVASNDTADGRASNRRVELVIERER